MELNYLDYISFRKANDEEINYLINNKSLIIARFKYVLLVVDYLYDKAVNKKEKLNKDEEEMFEVGYKYIYDRFLTINTYKENVFNNNIKELDKFGKTLNLLLYVDDFIDELDSIDGEHKAEHKKFSDFEEQVSELLENKTQAPDELFAVLDDISVQIFDSLGIEYYGITDIFYDIAIELDLIKPEDDDYLDIDELLQQQK